MAGIAYICILKWFNLMMPDIDDKNMTDSELVSEEVLEAMGVSAPAYQEIQQIIGRLPTVDEVSTLLAMWQTSGTSHGLLSWLRGQPHSVERHDFIMNEAEPQSREIKEPRVAECLSIARQLFVPAEPLAACPPHSFLHRGDAVYMVGDVSELFVDSDYGRQFLHLVDSPVVHADDAEARDYMELILSSLYEGGVVFSHAAIAEGGLFGTLLHCAAPLGMGFDILCCREVRLDAFLFGEQGVRYLVSLDEPHEDFFLAKLVEARLNCCFLGRTTKGRILVDGTDFGPVTDFAAARR